MQPFTCNISEMIWFCSMNLIQLTLLVTLVPRRYIGEETRSPGIDVYMYMSIFTSLYILKLKVERENIRFKIPTTAIDVKFKWLLYNWIAKNINWIPANLSPLKRFILNSTTVATLSLASRPRLQWKNVPIFKGINLTPPLSLSLPTNYVTGIWCYSTMN